MVLDLQQRAAVLSLYNNTLVLAGAGSGKTRVLVERVAHLIQRQKVSPYEIMALTFTRKASQEMTRRLEDRIGRLAHHLKIGTIHALALRFLRMYGDELGYRPGNLTVYGPWEEAFLIDETARLVKAKPRHKEVIEKFYQSGAEPEENSPHRRFFEVFMNRLRSNNSLTYGMLLVSMSRILGKIVERRISHVLVDEAQDIDLLQWQIIRGIQARGQAAGCSLFVVGDQDQSIYEWRGAVPDYLTAMKDHFKIFRLENNYRSHAEIVEPANRLIANNFRRLPKTMHPTRLDGGHLTIMRDMDSEDTAKFIAWQMQLPIGQKGGVAVLSRNHVLLEKLSMLLNELNVDHDYCGRSAKIMDTESFRRVHAIFKLAQNPFDNFAFALARPILGVDDEQFMGIMDASLKNYGSNLQEWLKGSPPAWAKEVFTDPLYRTRQAFGDLIEAVATAAKDYDTSIALKFARGCFDRGMGLTEYLDWIATYDIQEEVAEPQAGGLQLMTIHASKGLEFPTVIVIGFNEGILPSKQSISRDPNVEEERRLAYVAMTRAQKNLFLIVRPEVTENASRKYENPASRFLKEVAA